MSPLQEVESQFRIMDRLTAAQGTTQDLALKRRSVSESKELERWGRIPPLSDDATTTDAGIEEEVGKARRYDAQGQFSKNATVLYPYGKQRPSPTYHEQYPEGSGVGDNPNDPEEAEWIHELNKLIYEEEYRELSLGELDENYDPVQVQDEEIEEYVEEKERVRKYDLFRDRGDRSQLDREEKEDEILEMVRRGDDPNQEAFGPWYVCGVVIWWFVCSSSP
jgi:hypothetical protein